MVEPAHKQVHTGLYVQHMLLYRITMGKGKKSAKRVTRDDWLRIAVEILARDGISAVTVNALSIQIGVTRGSFYHHFKDRKDLSREMLSFWASKWTTSIREDVSALDLDGYQSLYVLMQLIRHRKAADYDIAIRSWALHDPLARRVVTKVDNIRLDYIRGLFQKIGFEGLDLENRARLFLYYAMAEPAFFAKPDKGTSLLLAEERLRFLTTGVEGINSEKT